jgi:S1-C subfamily serine protease
VAVFAAALLVVLALGTGLGAALAGRGGSPAGPVKISSTSSSSASTGTAAALQQSVESVLQSVESSVVEITATGGQGESIGSGDILTANGYIVTNDHVVSGYSTYTVTLANGKNYTASLVGQDAQDDLAVLKISATNLRPITLADSSKAQVGEFVVAVGNPLGLQESATFGIVSALNRTASEAPSGPAGELTGLIQTSAQLNPGNSGGALVNMQGQMVGIPTLGAENTETGTAADGIGYAIASDRVATVANQLIQSGKVTSTGQAFLGIQAQNVTAQVAASDGLSVQSGVLISGFASDMAGQSPAQQAGLQTGDVITTVNGQTINSSADLATALAKFSPGTKVTLTIERGTSQRTVTVILGERPA